MSAAVKELDALIRAAGSEAYIHARGCDMRGGECSMQCYRVMIAKRGAATSERRAVLLRVAFELEEEASACRRRGPPRQQAANALSRMAAKYRKETEDATRPTPSNAARTVPNRDNRKKVSEMGEWIEGGECRLVDALMRRAGRAR